MGVYLCIVYLIMALTSRDREYCPHCDEDVALATFQRHKALYFNQVIR